MMKLLEKFNWNNINYFDPMRFHIQAEVSKVCFEIKETALGDPQFNKMDIEHLMSNESIDNLFKKIKLSFEDSLSQKKKINDFVLEMKGLSGRKYRSLINSLISKMKNPSYLERLNSCFAILALRQEPKRPLRRQNRRYLLGRSPSTDPDHELGPESPASHRRAR